MKVAVKGTIKVIDKKEYVNRNLFQRGILIETEDKSDVHIKLQCWRGKEDYTSIIEDQNLGVGDRVECLVDISSRKWQYTYITNLTCTQIDKVEV